MKLLTLLIGLSLSGLSLAQNPYDYTIAQSNPLEAMSQGVEFGKQLQASSDPNAKPVYGQSGLPANCRAFVQYAIDSYKQNLYSADDVMASLERNCGMNGWLWSDYK